MLSGLQGSELMNSDVGLSTSECSTQGLRLLMHNDDLALVSG